MPAKKRTEQPEHQTEAAPAAAAQAPVEFTLDITFSGLCMLVKQTRDKERLLVLLPHTRAPIEGHQMPPHLAVIGTHERYMPEGPFKKHRRFYEFAMSEGTIKLPPLQSTSAITLKFDPELVGLFDLSAIANKPPVAEQARISMLIEGGEVCLECGFDQGATWHYHDGEHSMATRISWRIKGLTNTTKDGKPGVEIQFLPPPSQGEPSTFVIRPFKDPGSTKWRAAFYLYHTPESELPSRDGHPLRPEERSDPEVNHHFGAFYDLFVPRINVALPELIRDEDKDVEEEDAEDDDDSEVELTATLKQTAVPSFPERVIDARQGGGHGFHGRLYTCTAVAGRDPVPVSVSDTVP